MGEVFRARDTKLNRDVALKVLPDSFASDPDRLARFTREAQMLAALNHPNIAHIHGFEDGGSVRAIVMELVEGDDLSQRIALGAIPLDEALPIAKQIADALETAHDQGIIHRDLKPANIKLRSDGTVKVLDFGLAKALEPASATSANVTASPTITSPAAMTGVGVILGTAAYMAPEQAKGRPADKRADIWALGCVLYEMVTGLRAFSGEDVAETLAHILTKEPDWTALPASTPTPIRRLLRRCLEKDRRRRLADAADARLEMDEALASSGDASAMSLPMQKAAWVRALPWAVVGLLGAGLGLLLVLWAPWHQTAPLGVTRTTITHSGAAALTQSGFGRDIALSPDGRRLVYSGNNGTQLFVRALDALEPVAIATGTGGALPAIPLTGWSMGRLRQHILRDPEGRDHGRCSDDDRPGRRDSSGCDVGGRRHDRLRDQPSRHGVAARLGQRWRARHVDAARPRAWGSRSYLARTSARRPCRPLYDYVANGRSRCSPGSCARLAHRNAENTCARWQRRALRPQRALGLHCGGRATSDSLRCRSARDPRYCGHDVAAGLDDGCRRGGSRGNLAIANDGTLVYVDLPGGVTTNARTLVWVDRTGKEEAIDAPPRAYLQPRLSPDGKRVAVWSNDQTNDIWIWDLERKILTPLTRDPGEDQHPLWTRDGKRIIFSSNRSGVFNLWWQAADGTGEPEQLTTEQRAGVCHRNHAGRNRRSVLQK